LNKSAVDQKESEAYCLKSTYSEWLYPAPWWDPDRE